VQMNRNILWLLQSDFVLYFIKFSCLRIWIWENIGSCFSHL